MLRYSILSIMRIALVPLFFLSYSAPAAGQACSVGTYQDEMLPSGTGTSPTNADLSLSIESSYLYTLGQWGLLRTPVVPPENPGSYQLFQVGAQANGGVIPIHCDCYQGFNAFEVVDAPDGTSRMLSDWVPYAQGGHPPPPPNSNFSGLPAQLGQTTGTGAPAFGQQIDLPHSVPLGARLAAVYINSNPPKYFGYLPVAGQGVYMADLSSPTGDPAYQNPISASSVVGWTSPVGSTSARLKAAHVSAPGYDKYLLAGSTSDFTLHLAEINTDINNGPIGTPVEVGSISTLANPESMDIAVIDQRIFIFSAEAFQGLRVYEYQPPPAPGQPAQMSFVTQITTGKIMRALVRGSVLLLHRVDPTTFHSFIDLYGTDWVTQPNPTPPSSPGLSIPHYGAAEANYRGWGVDIKIPQNGDTGYLYRRISSQPEESIRTHTLNLSCLVNPNSAPIASIENGGTNASFGYRTDHTNYLGDLWSFQADSLSPPSAPTTGVQWDINVTSDPPSPDFGGIQGWPQASRLPASPPATVTFPCDPNPPLVNGIPMYPPGHPDTGVDCWKSVGSPSAGSTSYTVSVQTINANGPSNWAPASQAVKAPQISLFGLQGTVLHILDGGTNNGDASQSQGNVQSGSPGHATFAWTVGTPNASPAIGQALSCPLQTLQGNGSTNTIPGSSTEPTNCPFTLTVTYNGGYNVSQSGTLSQDGLVAEFSVPTQVVPGPLSLTNLSRKLTATNAGSPSYTISPLSGGATLSGPLPAFGWGPPDASGTTELGTGTQSDVDISTLSTGDYTVTLTYPYGAGLVATVSHPLSVVEVVANPTLGVFGTASQTQPVVPFGGTFYLTTGRTYYLFDVEPNFPPNASAAFYSSTNPSQPLPTAGGNGPATFVAATACPACSFQVVVNGQTGVFPYNVAGGGGGCGSNCGGGNPTLTMAPAQPAAPRVGDLVTFAALAQNFTGNVSYQWDFGDGGTPGPPNCSNPNPAACQGDVTAFAAGPNPNSHAYAAAGTYTVIVQASGGNGSRTASQVITVSGVVAPVVTFSTSTGTLQGPVKTAIAFTADESHAASWDWDFGDGSPHGSGQTAVHDYEGTGPYTVTLTVTGDGTNTSVGPVSASQTFTVFDPKILTVGEGGRYQIQVSWSSSSQGTSGVGTAVQLTPDSGYFWFFYPDNVEVVAKVLDGCGINGYRWVFAGGLTNLGITMTVTDSVIGASSTKTYTNTEGAAFQPIQDVKYEACPASGSIVARATTAPTVTLAAPSPASPTTGQTVAFAATASGFPGTVTYLWLFGDCFPGVSGCTSVTGATDGTVSHTYTDAGTYTVSVVAQSGSVSRSASVSVTVTGQTIVFPSADFTATGATPASSSSYAAIVDEPVTFTAAETHASNFLWNFGDGKPTISGPDQQTVTHTFESLGTFTVTLTVSGDNSTTFNDNSRSKTFTVSDPYTLWLDNNRFAVTLDYSTSTGGTSKSGKGNRVPLTNDTGFFWLFDPSNTEVVVKVIDACSAYGHFWVFASGLTNVGTTLTVSDTQNGGVTQTYTNADGSAFAPVQDFSTFHACGSP